jgi:membrane-associated phospholipid phosphatase
VPDLAFLSLLDDESLYVGDFKAFMTAPAYWTRREWTRLGGLLAATRVAYEYDYDVREHFVSEPRPRDYHDVEDFVPVGLMIGATWFSARRTGDFDRFGEAKAMVRAGVLSTASTLVFKLGLGRERPDEGVERDDWWSGGRSMPSGHTALAFSVGTVFAESGTPKRRWVRRTLGYGLGVGMMYLRVDHDSHWFSDTIPGAALGIAAGRFVLNRSGPSDGRAAIFASPLDGGAMLTFSFALD